MSKTQNPDDFSESTDEGTDRQPRDHGIFDDEFSRASQDIDEIIAFIATNLRTGQRMPMPFGFLPKG